MCIQETPLVVACARTREFAQVPAMPTAACRHGLVRGGGCARDMYMNMEEHRSAYFSWWNVVLVGIGLALALLVYLPLNFANGGAYLRGKHAWWVHYLVTPVIVASCTIGVSIALTSQGLLASNLDAMIGTDGARTSWSRGLEPDSHVAELSIQVPAVQNFLHHNYIVHLVPGAVAVVVLLVLATGSLHGADVRTVTLSTLLICAVIWVAYFSTPVVGARDGKTYVGWSKLVHVYSNPSPLTIAGHCAFAVACALLVPYFVIGRGTTGPNQSDGPGLVGPGLLGSALAVVTGQPKSISVEVQGGALGAECGAQASLSRIADLVRMSSGDVGGAGAFVGHALPSLPP